MINGVLEVCPYEPPVSGWTTRVKLVRSALQARGTACEILDIGPSRRIIGRDCIPVFGALDYFRKIVSFAREGYCLHGHINGSYLRGQALILAALIVMRSFGNRCVVTFHGGTDQPFFRGAQRFVTWPVTKMVFLLSHVVICNSDAEKRILQRFGSGGKIEPIPAFSLHYLDYMRGLEDAALEQFTQSRSPLFFTYLCFREGFFIEVLIEGLAKVVADWPGLGLVIVGTGDDEAAARQRIQDAGITDNIYIHGDSPHDEFMTLLDISDAYLRTCVSDGVSASVLEALALGTPVVAGENGHRPPTVLTYTATDPNSFAEKLTWVLNNLSEVTASVTAPDLGDTVEPEVDLLLDSRVSPAANAGPDA